MKGSTELLNKLTTSKEDQYFAIRAERYDWLGERAFKYNHVEDKVVQVTINPGPEHGRGKKSMIGVYLLGKLTFLSNYLAMNYVEPISKKEYEKKFDAAIKILRNMNTEQHTVTIPIADYNELLAKANQSFIAEHLELLFEDGRIDIQNMDLSKKPIKSAYIDEMGRRIIRFKYE